MKQANKYVYWALLAIITILLFIWLNEFSQQINNLSQTAESAMGNYYWLGIVIFLGLGILSAILWPFTSLPLVPLAVGLWGKTLTLIFLLVGWLLGDIIAYFIGKYAGSALISKLTKPGKINFYQNKLSPSSKIWLMLLFRLVVPTELGGLLLGLIKYPLKKYLLITLLAELTFGIIAIYIGDAIVNLNIWEIIIWGILTIILFWGLNKTFRRNINNSKPD